MLATPRAPSAIEPSVATDSTKGDADNAASVNISRLSSDTRAHAAVCTNAGCRCQRRTEDRHRQKRGFQARCQARR